jgi:hypothetical protein
MKTTHLSLRASLVFRSACLYLCRKERREGVVKAVLLCCTAALLLVGSAVITEAYKLPETGQILCYDTSGTVVSCIGSGQDGAYNINPMSYIDNGNGIVTDYNTGLMWQKQDDGSLYNWAGAQSVCDGLPLGDYTDWRAPTKKELTGIVDYAVTYSNPIPTINTTYFPNTHASAYFSSTQKANVANNVWFVDFLYARADYGSTADISGYVRCVRGGQTAQSFTDNGGGIVTDNKTGLMWQQAESSPSYINWDDALSHCENLPLGGYSDWRLPNIKELESLTDDTTSNPAINTSFFPTALASLYWSSTTYSHTASQAFNVDFLSGRVSAYFKSNSSNTRCVRGGGVNVCPANAATISGIIYYTTIQSAYAAATTGQSVLAQAMFFPENVTFASTFPVTLKGGYDCTFGSNPGYSTLIGSLTIKGGPVTLGNLVIK